MGIFLNQGQVCCAGSRVFVQQGIYDQFTEQLSEMANGIKLGNPLDPVTRMGPLVSKEQHERVIGYLNPARAKARTSRLAARRVIRKRGYFIKPTVFTDVNNR